MPMLRDFGIVMALNVLVALLSALIVLPPILVWAEDRGLVSRGLLRPVPEPFEFDVPESSTVPAQRRDPRREPQPVAAGVWLTDGSRNGNGREEGVAQHDGKVFISEMPQGPVSASGLWYGE
jgi:hypothetical protein